MVMFPAMLKPTREEWVGGPFETADGVDDKLRREEVWIRKTDMPKGAKRLTGIPNPVSRKQELSQAEPSTKFRSVQRL